MAAKLERIAEKARQKPSFRFTNLFYLMNDEILCRCVQRLRIASQTAAVVEYTQRAGYSVPVESEIWDRVRRSI